VIVKEGVNKSNHPIQKPVIISHAAINYMTIHSLAYVDDIAHIARTLNDLQRLLEVTGRVADQAGL
jgi:hypothetical protein